MKRFLLLMLVAAVTGVPGCGGEPDPVRPLDPGQFAFGVFGDGPYRAWEVPRFHRVIDDANRAHLSWFLHVGDILWFPCSDETYAKQFAEMNTIRCPVVYTPGDNEWADCHRKLQGRHAPLERLARLRATFFANPGRSLGAVTMAVESQGADARFAEFVENARWVRGGFVFATMHLVGSQNAGKDFEGRTPGDDAEAARRMDAALAWMEEAFAIAARDSLSGVVLAMHADPGISRVRDPVTGYAAFVDRLAELTRAFPGPVVLIHGDSHDQRTDHLLRDRATGEVLPNFTRIESYGSPEIGWVRVVVDSLAGRIVEVDARRMGGILF